MRLTKSQSALFNARELRLLTAKGPREVSDLATAIRQVRDLRDKQRDLLQRQDKRLARSGAGRVGASGVANERTAAKERLLDEALDEMQQELRRIDQESTQACRELLDDEDSVPGRRANPQKASKRAAKKSASTGTGRAAKKSTTSAAAKKGAGAATKKSATKRTAAKKGVSKKSASKKTASKKRSA
ncbi:hypothetical protein GCM10007067_21600 [Lysobacter bugurensis]|uniref:Uncharacterized protein n=1 Tax=Cognatilysobacter bugurensis TaxID=543356 RepID=A0A918T0M3_9GAMM|nr:hypothetical protein [Lysobacter bugurensis]GHA83166.1 hypothetical protein GCM10007067_21600 [Lysobacter bugurensis]